MPFYQSSNPLSITIEPYADAPVTYHEYDGDAPAVARLLADAITVGEKLLVVEQSAALPFPGVPEKVLLT